jgi:hypothetical protein
MFLKVFTKIDPSKAFGWFEYLYNEAKKREQKLQQTNL